MSKINLHEMKPKNLGYIKYSRPYKHEDDEPPIEEIWTNGDKPKKRLADGRTLYVYDYVDGTFINERTWDGIE
jgi:hypothetical protein